MNHPQLFSLPAHTDLLDFRRQIIERPWLASRIELVTFGPATMVKKGRWGALPWISLLGATGAAIGAGIVLFNNQAPLAKVAIWPIWCVGSTAMLLAGVLGAAIGSLVAGAVTFITFRCQSTSAFAEKNDLLESVIAVDANAHEMMDIRSFFSQWKAVEIGRSDEVAAITGREISHRLAVFKREGKATMIA